MRVVPGAAENLFDPPASNHSRARGISFKLPDDVASFANRRRIETKSPPSVVFHNKSCSCLPSAHANDELLDTDEALHFSWPR